MTVRIGRCDLVFSLVRVQMTTFLCVRRSSSYDDIEQGTGGAVTTVTTNDWLLTFRLNVDWSKGVKRFH